jgi:hypothetical protein
MPFVAYILPYLNLPMPIIRMALFSQSPGLTVTTSLPLSLQVPLQGLSVSPISRPQVMISAMPAGFRATRTNVVTMLLC